MKIEDKNAQSPAQNNEAKAPSREMQLGVSGEDQNQEVFVNASEEGVFENAQSSAQNQLPENVDDIQTGLELPPGVTIEPQHPEHAHIGSIGDSMSGVEVYLKVSDDVGEFHGDPELETEVKVFCGQQLDLDACTLHELDEIIAKGKILADRYGLRINMAKAFAEGTIAKYRIRQGLLFVALEPVVKKRHNLSLRKWVRLEFGLSKYRSILVYLSLAKIPNIIRYSCLGLDRLIQVERVVKDQPGDDPIATFLAENGISFDPAQEFDLVDYKQQVDTILSINRLASAGITGIPRAKVELLVRSGIMLEPSHIRELEMVKKTGGNIEEYLELILAKKGSAPPVFDTQRRVTTFSKKAKVIFEIFEEFKGDENFLNGISPEDIKNLREVVEEIEKNTIEREEVPVSN